MKVIATEYKKERLVIDGVDAFTASMCASVLNEIEARVFYAGIRTGRQWRFYSARDDDYAVPMGAET